jgi:hypothetical protein
MDFGNQLEKGNNFAYCIYHDTEIFDVDDISV